MAPQSRFNSLRLRLGPRTLVLAPARSWAVSDPSRLPKQHALSALQTVDFAQLTSPESLAFWRRFLQRMCSVDKRITAFQILGDLRLALERGELFAGFESPNVQMSVQQVFSVTAEQLKAIMPGAASGDIDAALDSLNAGMADHGIDSAYKAAAFLAQLAVESQELSRTEENLRYITPGRLKAVFGAALFPTDESEKPYLRNPEKLANYVYATKNGNRGGTDGWDFRGRGYIQVTGRETYRAVGYESNPGALTTPEDAAISATAYWKWKGLNKQSTRQLTRGEFDVITKMVNSKSLDAQGRWEAYERALKALNVYVAPIAAASKP